MNNLIVHSSPDGVKEPQLLYDHSTAVAAIARNLFSVPIMRDDAYALGLYHDVGWPDHGSLVMDLRDCVAL